MIMLAKISVRILKMFNFVYSLNSIPPPVAAVKKPKLFCPYRMDLYPHIWWGFVKL